MSLIPTPLPLMKALADALAAEKKAQMANTSDAWQVCANAWREVARLNRQGAL